MGNTIRKRDLWLFGSKCSSLLKDKNLLIDTYIRRFFARTSQIFEYKNLPETIPQRELELIIQFCRFAIFTKVNDKFFVFYGGLAGEPNEYYQPTQAVVTNPYLRYSEVLKLTDYIKDDADAVLIWNDSSHMGLYPLFEHTAELLTECDISLRYSLINKRFMNVLTGDDDNTKESLEKMFDDVENGTGFGIVVTKQFMEESSIGKIDMKLSQNTDLKDIMEIKQYVLGSFYNEIGLNALFNMKRESINESESNLNEDALLPFIDDMLEQRKIAVESINKKFNLNIEVDLKSSWKKIREEIELKDDILKSESESSNKEVVDNSNGEEDENVSVKDE